MPRPFPASAEVIARIRHHRRARGMSAQALADAITAVGYPLGRATLAGQETGRAQTVSVDQVVAAAQVFGVPLSRLLEDVPCHTCKGAPPEGFACNTCGTGTRT